MFQLRCIAGCGRLPSRFTAYIRPKSAPASRQGGRSAKQTFLHVEDNSLEQLRTGCMSTATCPLLYTYTSQYVGPHACSTLKRQMYMRGGTALTHRPKRARTRWCTHADP